MVRLLADISPHKYFLGEFTMNKTLTTLCLSLVVLTTFGFTSCGMLSASGIKLEIPTDATQTFTTWADALPGYANRNGDPAVIDEVEFDMWATWVAFEAIRKYAVQAPTGPVGPSATTVTLPIPSGTPAVAPVVGPTQ